MSQSKIFTVGDTSTKEVGQQQSFYDLFAASPIPPSERLRQLELYQSRQSISRILYMNELYERIVDVPGVILEFGVRWGRNLALYESLRGIYEPYNYTRKIIGFDTFEGFPSVSNADGKGDAISVGAYGVTEEYQEHLRKLLDYHESQSPQTHIKKYELVIGDATKTVPTYMQEHPETIVALAYFDFDLYEPTKKCLEAILPYCTKGTVLAFDELLSRHFPGETIALRETLTLSKYKLFRSRYATIQTYLVLE